MLIEDIANNTSLEIDPSHDSTTTSAIEESAFLIDELDLSYNDIGGEGVHPPNPQMLNSVRRLFEGGRAAPRVLCLENCSLGPAFCRSIGRVSAGIFEYN